MKAPTGATRPVLGIALGDGGVRGFMHLGVVKALEGSGLRETGAGFGERMHAVPIRALWEPE